MTMIPKIRFSEFVEEWKETKLEDLLIVNSGKDYKHLKEGNIPVYGTGGYMLSVDQSLSSSDAIGIGRKGTIDKPQFLKAPFWTVDTLFFLTLRKKDDLKFLYNLAQKLDWRKYDESTGVPSLSKSNIINIEVSTPTLSEQRRISQFFTLLDETIRLEGERLASLKQVKAASLQSFFPQEGEKEPRVRFKGFSGEWKKVRLGDCGFTYSGIGFPEKEQGGQSGIPFYKVSDMNNIGNEHIMISSNNYVSKKQIEENHWNVCKSVPAIFFAKVGAAVLLDRKRLVVEPCICDNNTMMYCLDTKIWDKYFCLKCFENIRLSALIQVGTLPSYNASTIENIEVFIPTLAEQCALSTYFTNIDEQIRLEREKIEKMKKVKGACLEGMMV